MIFIRSKLIALVAVYLLGTAIWSFLEANGSFLALRNLADVQATLGVLVAVTVGIGLLFNKLWAMWLYFGYVPLAFLIALLQNLAAELPTGSRIAAYAVLLAFVAAPAFLIWLRRNQLDPLKRSSASA